MDLVSDRTSNHIELIERRFGSLNNAEYKDKYYGSQIRILEAGNGLDYISFVFINDYLSYTLFHGFEDVTYYSVDEIYEEVLRKLN